MTKRFVVSALIVAGLIGCGDADHATGASIDGARTSPHRGADGIRYRTPADWAVARRSLTPHLTNPREVLTAGTGRLPTGGACAHMPSAALQAMRPTDVLVTVQERFGGTRRFPARPTHFTLPAGDRHSEAHECAGPHPTFTSSWFGFREHHRGFHVLVAIGRAASAARIRDAEAILNSLRLVRPRPHGATQRSAR